MPDDIAVCGDCIRQSEIGRMMMERQPGWQRAVMAENIRQMRSPAGITFILWLLLGLPVSYWLATDALADWFERVIPPGKGNLPQWIPAFLLLGLGAYLLLYLATSLVARVLCRRRTNT